MNEIVRRMPGRWRGLATAAVDATGLAQAAVSSYFIRRVEHFGQKQRTWKHWLKWLAVVDVERQIILAQWARHAPWNDCATLPVLVAQAHQNTPIGCVLADAEFDSERNHTFCREQLHAQSIIPAKRRSSCRASGVRLQMRDNFPTEQYGKRSLIESVFSAVKRKLSCRAPGELSTPNLVRHFCSAWPSTSTASGRSASADDQRGCQQGRPSSRSCVVSACWHYANASALSTPSRKAKYFEFVAFPEANM